MKCNYNITTNIMSIQRNLLALPTMNFLSSAPPPTFLPSYGTEGHFNSFAETNKKAR